MHRILRFLIVIMSGLAGFVQAAPPEPPLKHFTGDVDILIRLKEPDRTAEKVIGLVNQVQPGAGDALKNQQTAVLGKIISNPSLTGVDQTQDWYAGVYFASDKVPVVVFAIPALKPDDVVSAVAGMTTQVHGKWVLYTDAEEIPRATSPTAFERLGEAHLKLLQNGDLTFYINTRHLAEIYAEQIELAQDRVLENLNQLRFMPSQGTLDPQQMVELYGGLAEGLFQAVADAQTAMASLSINDTGVVFTKQVDFAADSQTSQFLSSNKPDAMADLSRLPSGAVMYYGLSGAMKEMVQTGVKMSLGMSKDPALAQRIEQAMSHLEAVTFGPTVASLAIDPSSKTPFQAVTIVQSSPVDDVRKFNREIVKASGVIENDVFKQTSTLKTDAETIGTHPVDLVEVHQEIKPEAPGGEMQRNLQKMMFGEGGMRSRTVYLDMGYVTTMGGGEKLMKDFLEGKDSSKTDSLQKVRDSLMKQANVVLLVDQPRLIGEALSAASESVEGFPLPINSQMIRSLNLKPSYLGLAAGSSPNTARFELHLPVDQIIGLSKLGVLIGTTVRGGL